MNGVAVLKTVSRWVFPLASGTAVAFVWAFPHLVSYTVQMVILAVVVLLLGLPHGALDPWLARSTKLQGRLGSRFVFHAVYLLLCLLVVLAWVLFPTACLLVFLAISAWHFSTDWRQRLTWVWRASLGALLLLMPIGFHTEEVAVLFAHLSGEGGAALAHALALPIWILAFLMALLASVAAVNRQWPLAMELLVLLLLAYTVPPLVYFALYFCLLHSPRHMVEVFEQAPHREHAALVRTMGFYTAAAVMGLLGLAWLWSSVSADTLVMRVVFVGLAALTVPHMAVIGMASWRRRHSQKNGW